MKLTTKYSSHSTLHIGYKEKYIGERLNKKFLCLQTDNHIYWEDHIEQMISKLSAACFAVKSMVQISNINILKSIYYAYYHSLIIYEIIIKLFYQQMHYLLKHKMLQFVFKYLYMAPTCFGPSGP
jgi:hypothetical protein